MDLVGGDGQMLHAAWDDRELALVQPQVAVAQLDEQSPLDDEEQLILVFVPMPDELAFELDQLDIRVVQLARDLGTPVVL